MSDPDVGAATVAVRAVTRIATAALLAGTLSLSCLCR
jgi:hypothetical protein